MIFFTAIEATEEMDRGEMVIQIGSFLEKIPDQAHLITSGELYSPFLIMLSHKTYRITYLEDEFDEFDEVLERTTLPTFTLLLDKMHHMQCERIILYSTTNVLDHMMRIQYGNMKILDRHTSPENAYLDLLHHVAENGEKRVDRTGTGTRSVFGIKLEFDLTEGLPVLTTKFVPFRHILVELFWFLSGSTDTSFLEKNGVKIWRGNTSSDFLQKRGLVDYKEGDTGPLYGYQWRRFGETSERKGVDQIDRMLQLLKTEPTSRRILMSAWNPMDLDKMVLEPCHVSFQLYVRQGRWLDGMLYMRSNDLFLGAPWNIVCYSLLIYMYAHLTGYLPGKLVYTVGDAHVYEDHLEQVKEQYKRPVRWLPRLTIKSRDQKSMDDFQLEDFVLEGYYPHPRLSAKMSV
jgi:thymidylate synthase